MAEDNSANAGPLSLKPILVMGAIASIWVAWAAISSMVFFGTNTYHHFCFRTLSLGIQSLFMTLFAVASHIYYGKSLSNTLKSLTITSFLIAMVFEGFDSTSHYAIHGGGMSVYFIGSLALGPLSWFTPFLSGLRRFDMTQCICLITSIMVMGYMYFYYFRMKNAHTGEHFFNDIRKDSTNVHYFSVYASFFAMIYLSLFSTVKSYLFQEPSWFSLFNQVWLVQFWNTFLTLAGSWKYEHFHFEEVMTMDMLPWVFVFAIIDALLVLMFFLSSHMDGSLWRGLSILCLPLAVPLQFMMVSPILDSTQLTAAILMFGVAIASTISKNENVMNALYYVLGRTFQAPINNTEQLSLADQMQV